MAVKLIKKRTGSKDIVMAGDTVNQTLTLSNNGDVEVTDIYIKDTFSEGITFVTGSVAVGGTSYAGYNPVDGFKMLGTILSGNSQTVTYRVKIDDAPTVAKMNIFSTVTFTADGNAYTENSDTYNMQIANGEMSIAKTSSQSAVIKGQKMTFQNVITNDGNLRNTNIVFKDDIPQGITFVDGSVKVDNVAKQDYDPAVGFTLSNLDGGQKTTVTFDVLVQ